MKLIKQDLATRDLAMTMAESLVTTIYGSSELEAQRPLLITDSEDRWVIEGSRLYKERMEGFEQLTDGRVVIEILKRNCQVLRLTQMVAFAPD
ncbi:MAG: NTF2 fold immunity protein [Caulobacteraceae bacterium]|nr:NTF2 fold immunity protein [Caulobacteraceae bacterium]